jgi:hypothetical protein
MRTFIAIALAWLLAIAGPSSAQMTLTGAGSVKAPQVSTTGLTFLGSTGLASSSSSSISGSYNVGTSANTLVIVAYSTPYGGGTTTVTASIGAFTPSPDSVQNNTADELYAANFSHFYSTGPGSITITVSAVNANFVPQAFFVYTLVGGSSTTDVQTGGFTRSGGTFTPTSPTIPVVNGDHMIASVYGLAPPQLPTGMSVAPTNTRTEPNSGLIAWDWSISTTNPSFTLANGNNDSAVAVSTYH